MAQSLAHVNLSWTDPDTPTQGAQTVIDRAPALNGTYIGMATASAGVTSYQLVDDSLHLQTFFFKVYFVRDGYNNSAKPVGQEGTYLRDGDAGP